MNTITTRIVSRCIERCIPAHRVAGGLRAHAIDLAEEHGVAADQLGRRAFTHAQKAVADQTRTGRAVHRAPTAGLVERDMIQRQRAAVREGAADHDAPIDLVERRR